MKARGFESRLIQHQLEVLTNSNPCQAKSLYPILVHWRKNRKQKMNLFFLLHNTQLVHNHLKHLRRTSLGVLIRPVWLWHHFHLVYCWLGSNPWPFGRVPSLLPTRPQLSHFEEVNLKTGLTCDVFFQSIVLMAVAGDTPEYMSMSWGWGGYPGGPSFMPPPGWWDMWGGPGWYGPEGLPQPAILAAV